MPIPQPNLDDRTFTDLVAELRSLIPGHCPEWTDHNTSDPGITLVELFAFVAETLLYRANRIPEASRRRFLELLGGVAGADLNAAQATVVRGLQARWRAVTVADFEGLVVDQFPTEVARARCLPDLAPGEGELLAERLGHVSVIVVPWPQPGEERPVPGPALREKVHRFLDERRLITCRHHVVAPTYVPVAVAVTVAGRPGTSPAGVEAEVWAGLGAFLAPVSGAPGNAEGWPFGRDVHVSELCALLESLAGVEHVESLTLRERVAEAWTVRDERLAVPADSLVQFIPAASTITVLPPV